MSDARPRPAADADSEPFWSAARDGRLILQRCGMCESYIHYPRFLCPTCHARELEWVDAAGTGVIYSYTVSRRPPSPAFADAVPYVVALVELTEGPRLMTNIVDAPEDVWIGAPVEVIFETIDDACTLPVFRLLTRT